MLFVSLPWVNLTINESHSSRFYLSLSCDIHALLQMDLLDLPCVDFTVKETFKDVRTMFQLSNGKK